MTKILAVVDFSEDRHTALERCREVPPRGDVDIHAALFVEHESAETFASTFNERSAMIKELVLPLVADGYRVTTEVVPFNKLYEAVIETATKNQCDLVFKPMRQHSLFETVVRTTTDWNLIRHCIYPLFLVSELDAIQGKPIVAAVDVCSEDEKHDELNDIVIESAKRVTRITGGEIYLANSWQAATPMAAVGSVDATPLPSSSQLVEEHRKAAMALAEKHQLNPDNIRIEEGNPVYAITAVAKSLNAGSIVIGTVARKGLSGMLIGNTAEGVLESSPCDVMVVKHPDI